MPSADGIRRHDLFGVLEQERLEATSSDGIRGYDLDRVLEQASREAGGAEQRRDSQARTGQSAGEGMARSRRWRAVTGSAGMICAGSWVDKARGRK